MTQGFQHSRTQTNLDKLRTYQTLTLAFPLGMGGASHKKSHKNNCLSFSFANVDIYYATQISALQVEFKLIFPPALLARFRTVMRSTYLCQTHNRCFLYFCSSYIHFIFPVIDHESHKNCVLFQPNS